MRSRKEIDPELHILKSAGRLIEGRERQQFESARFNLFAAFEGQNAESAQRWARALAVDLTFIPEGESRRSAAAALAAIEQAIAS